ncbi:MAG: RdgB/HAM1 family non-canonical purine NTP pyrophosphatase [Bacteroidia bacterium]|nr:RdgB/HAM1 family non-canonical purine NTP pyrophosphatase [Bacteroidia bacterium]
MRFIFASNNVHKLAEIRKCFPSGYEVQSLANIGFSKQLPETGKTLRQNALMKARYVYDRTTGGCFADDSGLEIEALNGRPGVYSARYAGPECTDQANIKKVLEEMNGITNRNAVFRTVITIIVSDVVLFFEGKVKGFITHSPLGYNGFGYDPIFIPEGYQKTFAQMTASEKNEISHRSIACRELSRFLLQYQIN